VTDVVDKKTRSRMMSGIQGKDTKPELIIRKGLFARGFRYLLHDKRLPGKPDLVLPKYNAVILVHGCFWHAHGCVLFKWPKTRKTFWREKISGNKARDERNTAELLSDGWRVMQIWECSIKGPKRKKIDVVLNRAEKWLLGKRIHGEISG
jgi:DNA mismatch endonuclease (patch repair protein)